MMFGFVCVSLEREAPPPPGRNFIKGKQMAATSQMGPREDGRYASQREAPTDAEARARKRPIQGDARLDKRITDRKTESSGNLVPMVPGKKDHFQIEHTLARHTVRTRCAQTSASTSSPSSTRVKRIT